MVGGNPGFPPRAPALAPRPTVGVAMGVFGAREAPCFPKYFTTIVSWSLIPALGSGGCH